MAGLLVFAGTGCAGNRGPETLVIAPSQYGAAFDVAVEASRQAGMQAVRRDRRGGIIETDAQIAGSLLEPWRQDNTDLSQAVENTIAMQRRRVRFEFVPADREPPVFDAEQPLLGADVPDLRQTPVDLTTYDGPIRLVVWVAVERMYRSDTRRGSWSRRAAVRTEPWEELPGQHWMTISRDHAYERRLLAEIERGLAKSP